ncbi:MAG TPA: oxidoreductase [Micromonosporaceae bacterium]|nr:oxidoreductase [Micromonosporaceae bacterium]
MAVVTDPLADLLDLADVKPALDDARAAVDDALRHRALRRSGGPVAAEVGLRCAVAAAALEGHGHDREEVRDGLVTDPVLQGALRVSRSVDGLAPLWTTAPRQVLARLHVLAARDVVADPDLGRPVADLGVATRLNGLSALVTDSTSAPAMLMAAVVCGELLALAPFAGPSGLVARGAGRVALIAGGLDPRGLLAVDVGHLAREPEYRGASGAFATGTPDGVRAWLKHYAAAVTVAAGELVDIADAL